MAANGNTGTATSASQAQSQAAAGNAAASNAANGNTGTGNTSNTSGTSEGGKGNAGSTNTSTSNNATNSAGLMGSLMSFGNAVTGNVGNTYGGSGSSSSSGNDSDGGNKSNLASSFLGKAVNALKGFNTRVANAFMSTEEARNSISPEAVAAGDKAYTEARAMGKTEAEAQAIAMDVATKINSKTSVPGDISTLGAYGFKGKNTGPTYNPANTAKANTNKTIAAGSSNSPAATTNNTPGGNIGGKTGGIAGGTESGTESAAPSSTNDATNTGVTNRGSTVTNGGGTSVTDSGTGGSISSSVTPPSRDSSSIGLGVYNTDRANYDQDNWNRGMEVESSSLVSDEECKAFAKRAFMEDSEPFKKVRVSIIKKC